MAEHAVKHVRGVRGVRNHLTVRAQADEPDIERRILRALHQNADLNARHIKVQARGDIATSGGTVG